LDIHYETRCIVEKSVHTNKEYRTYWLVDYLLFVFGIK